MSEDGSRASFTGSVSPGGPFRRDRYAAAVGGRHGQGTGQDNPAIVRFRGLVRVIRGAVKLGRYWDRTTEIDVAAVDEKSGVVLAGECKWTRKPVDLDVARELERKVTQAWPEKHPVVKRMIFSAGGFTAAVHRWAALSATALVDVDSLCAQGK